MRRPVWLFPSCLLGVIPFIAVPVRLTLFRIVRRFQVLLLLEVTLLVRIAQYGAGHRGVLAVGDYRRLLGC